MRTRTTPAATTLLLAAGALFGELIMRSAPLEALVLASVGA
jgi:hypothetical protein